MGIRSSIYKYIPMVGYHHIIMAMLAIAIILLSILLAGCTSSNGLSNVYLLSIQYRNAPAVHPADPVLVNPGIAESVYNVSRHAHGDVPVLEVRAGYRGLCLILSDGQRLCSGAAALASMVKSSNATRDPLNLIWIAKDFKETIVFDGLIFIAIVLTFICFLLLGTFPGWHEEVGDDGSEREVKPFPSRPVSRAALGIGGMGFIFALISVLWQHVNSSAAGTMAESLTYGAVESHVGTAAMVLGWAAVALICLGVLALLVIIMSITLLTKLTDEA